MDSHVRKVALRLLAIGLAGAVSSCSNGKNGAQGAPGAAAVDRGSIAGSVKDQAGAAVAGAAVTTDPATVTAQTDTGGAFTLASIPIGAYAVVAAKTGYVGGRLDGVGVAAGATVHVTVAIAAAAPTAGSVSGTISGAKIGGAAALAGAQVCVEGTSTCTTTANDGTYTLSPVAPGFAFVSAAATGFLPGEARQAAYVAAGAAVTGADVTLSGKPPDAATYLGSTACLGCHSGLDPDVVAAWQGSAHASAFDRTTAHVDVTGWPAEPASCTAPGVLDSGVAAADPVDGATREVYLVRWMTGCGAGKPPFAMAFDATGTLDVLPVTGSAGGVATGAGACGNGGIVPAGTDCTANLGGAGATASKGWWQQEYLIAIGPAAKPSWVGWDTTNTPDDALVLPLAWNQRARGWIAAPDYSTDQGGTWSQSCSGCHEVGLRLALDATGHVASYSSAGANIGCEKCHGPGSAHVAASGDPKLIVNPRHLTAQAEREVCAQCHSQGVSSVSPAGAFGFAWNDQAAAGGGNFIAGVHALSGFQAGPSFGDPGFYWPALFPSSDHLTAVDVGASVHANNAYEKLTCAECHSGHGGTGGPLRFDRRDAKTGDDYAFQANDAVLRDDVACLACHATHGSFAGIALADAARYHLSMGGTALLNGAAFAPAASAQATSASLVATTVSQHMLAKAGMPAYYDPTGTVGGPVGRCASCHMPKTACTGSFFALPDARGNPANAIGDVTAHTFAVAWPDASLATVAAATSWDTVMPSSCGACHAAYRFAR